MEFIIFGDELLSNISMQIDLFVFKQDVNITSGICLNGSPKIRRDLIFQNDSKFQYPSTFQVVSTEQMYDLTETPLIIMWRLNHLTNAEWNERFVNQTLSFVIRSRFRRTNTSTWASH